MDNYEIERRKLAEDNKQVLIALLNSVDHISDISLLSDMMDTLVNIKITNNPLLHQGGNLTYFYLIEGRPSLLFISPVPLGKYHLLASLPGINIKELEERFWHLRQRDGWYEFNHEVGEFFEEMVMKFPPVIIAKDLDNTLRESGISLSDD